MRPEPHFMREPPIIRFDRVPPHILAGFGYKPVHKHFLLNIGDGPQTILSGRRGGRRGQPCRRSRRQGCSHRGAIAARGNGRQPSMLDGK
jgi:hypothetical protein